MKVFRTLPQFPCLAVLALAALVLVPRPAQAGEERGGRYIIEFHNYGTAAPRSSLLEYNEKTPGDSV